MTDVLILGGTGWLSGHAARRYIDAGAHVTCLARGERAAPEGAALVAGDRSKPGAYDVVAEREWDEVLDVSSDPGLVASAVAALADRAGHWTYISTVSVYADNDSVGADESATLVRPAEPGQDDDYSRAKVAAEASVCRELADRVAVIRPGLIVGAGDPTDRFGYWVSRFALADSDPVLTPVADGLGAQVIDVRDLADFVVRMGRNRWVGTANAVGEPLPLAGLLHEAADVAGFRGRMLEASDEWLLAHDVAHWMGPRSLPLWLPRDMPGFATRANTRYLAEGGRLRPLRETLESALIDERERGLDRARRSGLTRAEEDVLLGELSH